MSLEWDSPEKYSAYCAKAVELGGTPVEGHQLSALIDGGCRIATMYPINNDFAVFGAQNHEQAASGSITNAARELLPEPLPSINKSFNMVAPLPQASAQMKPNLGVKGSK